MILARLCIVTWMACLAASPACTSSSPSTFDPGLDLRIRIQGAELHQGPLGEDRGGPSVTQISRPKPLVLRGESSVALAGRLAQGGVALHIQAKGDDDHWVVNAKGEDFVFPSELVFSTHFALSHIIEEDELVLLLQAADKDGVLGPVTEVEFTISDERQSANLLVSLAWDAPADLDLYLELPDGTVVGAKNIHSFDLSPGSLPQSENPPGAFLDYDSNQECRLDLRNQEHILWHESIPLSGSYRVYAHLFSPCGNQVVNMVATARASTELLMISGASQTPFDSRHHPSEGEAPGLFMMEFEIP